MKRFSFLAVAATAIITLSACGTENSENKENSEKATETASVEANGEEKEETDSAKNDKQEDKDTASETDEASETDASSEESTSIEETATENEEESTDSADTASEDASSENASPEDDAAGENASEDTADSEEEAASEESTEAAETTDTEANSTTASEEEEAVTEKVTVYYLDGDLMNTISETRSLEAASENDLPFEAVQAWLDGPETEDAVSPLPVETEVQFVEFKDNTAYVSFEPSVLDATTVGSTLELAFVEQLAVLMDQFGYGQTQILIDGEVVTDFYGHREIDQPIEATDPSELYGSN
ncbi:Sporulation and spore germination [Marinococcus luteus]|uniref:Sporulation and spore germination n=1 Tax=Marinococcus luteus TaxID=1122204 RepID=A0A1H2T0Z4_9BACI|nr:GerMN domain-containing protein [Marinococcus luteus]SDW36969.1 Sporulation and spore germination [Marinococcus luteus]